MCALPGHNMERLHHLWGVAGRASGICIAAWGAVAADRTAHVSPALQALAVKAVVAHLRRVVATVTQQNARSA